MIRKGKIETLISERKFSKGDEKYAAVLLRLGFPFTRTDGREGYDYVLAEKIIHDSLESRQKLINEVGKTRTFSVYFRVRTWTDPNTGEMKYFQDARLTKIIEEK